MENNFYNQVEERAQSSALSFPALMSKVYLWMTLALVVTGMTAYYVASSPAILYAIVSNQIAFWGLFIGELVLVFVLSSRIMSLSFVTASLMFVIYSIMNGVFFSFILLAYTEQSIATTFLITAGTFGAMSLFGFVTKRDLSAMGRILFMLLIGLIIATVVNIFMKAEGLTLILNYAGVVIFVGLTAYDTQSIKQMLQEHGDKEGAEKIALLGSLSLYLDFINLFIYLLRFFGESRK
ncbi:MAG: Bax inhibitor-1/YccA family protein [Bacteroidales bacterium]|nr:Bax inhibitor-1/YccA family protein [Bacteroidales bacterium]MCI7378672.1 Bax inhibitor-1/YccA family protein [Bacteroidales bacterium]MDY5452586.1 Bax inhibitor-1/YccA family protein [Alloprevotella sp.]